MEDPEQGRFVNRMFYLAELIITGLLLLLLIGAAWAFGWWSVPLVLVAFVFGLFFGSPTTLVGRCG